MCVEKWQAGVRVGTNVQIIQREREGMCKFLTNIFYKKNNLQKRRPCVFISRGAQIMRFAL